MVGGNSRGSHRCLRMSGGVGAWRGGAVVECAVIPQFYSAVCAWALVSGALRWFVSLDYKDSFGLGGANRMARQGRVGV